jgi:hypothetical protein
MKKGDLERWSTGILTALHPPVHRDNRNPNALCANGGFQGRRQAFVEKMLTKS